jgi:hypothetical protein
VEVLAACATCGLTRKRSWAKSSCAAYRVLVSRPPPFVRRRQSCRGGTSHQVLRPSHRCDPRYGHQAQCMPQAPDSHHRSGVAQEVVWHNSAVLQYEGSSSGSCPVKLAGTRATAVTAPGRATRCGRHSRLRVFRRSAACVAGARGAQGAHARFAGAAGERPPRPRPHLSHTSVSTWALGSMGTRAQR